jgi:hypothetical protein
LSYLNKVLDKRGLTAFGAEDAQARNTAVNATLRVSFDLLHSEQYNRYQELGVPVANGQKPTLSSED